MLTDTTEIRWFIPAAKDEAALAWFLDQPADWTDAPEQRTDAYLLLPGVPHTGIKRREGLLQVKVRNDGSKELVCNGGPVGTIERWSKWSIAAPGEENAGRAGETDGERWINIQKLRFIRYFTNKSDKVFEVFEPAESGETTLHAELTRVSFARFETKWLTFAIEVHGIGPEQTTGLSAALDFFCTSQPQPHWLTAASCASYPAWLARQKV